MTLELTQLTVERVRNLNLSRGVRALIFLQRPNILICPVRYITDLSGIPVCSPRVAVVERRLWFAKNCFESETGPHRCPCRQSRQIRNENMNLVHNQI